MKTVMNIWGIEESRDTRGGQTSGVGQVEPRLVMRTGNFEHDNATSHILFSQRIFLDPNSKETVFHQENLQVHVIS